jgi:C4-dicarboxylate transporter DctM subunit
MIVAVTLVALALIGAPLFVIVGLVTGVSFWEFTDDIHKFSDFGHLVEPLEELLGKDSFLAIPLFIASGAIMTAGGLAKRLTDVAQAALGWMPGGMGITAVMSCMAFAAISGSSPVTLIAVGSIMYPAMVKARYPDNFSLGLVMTAGSLGCLVMPALILLIYAISVSGAGAASVDPSDMFIAALVPALGIAMLLSLYSVWVGLKIPREKVPFTWPRFFEGLKGLGRATMDGIWALLLPVIVLGGILWGFYPPFQAGAVAVVYSLIVTTVIYRELDLKGLILELAEAGKLMGMLILIIGLAFGLNKFLALIEVEKWFVALIEDWNLGPIGFMLLVNVVLIVLGALMDSISATLIFAPLLAPIAVTYYGMDPLHFGVVFVVNMEIGYLAPPVATNLFVAAALFKKPFGQVCRAILPGLGITCAALVLFMYVPTCSKGLINYKCDLPVWESFPWNGESAPQCASAANKVDIGQLNENAEENLEEDSKKLNQQTDDEYYFGTGGGTDDPSAPDFNDDDDDDGVKDDDDDGAKDDDEDDDGDEEYDAPL